MRHLLPLALLVSLAFGQSQSPSLPAIWVDNEELTCQLTSSCYVGSPALTTPYTPPAYELALGANSWISGPPPAFCSFSTSQPLYPATAAGKQSAINDIEACRTAGIANHQAIGIILDVPPGTYTSANGLVIPQTSNIPATAPLIIRSTKDSTLASLPEPVCAGGIQDNIPESTNIGLINSDCQAGAGGGTFGYQLGTTVTTLGTGKITLANGVKTNSSSYNYLQYMYQDQCTATGCAPFQLCSPNGVNSAPCGPGVNTGPDHWEFEDGGAALAPGNVTDNNVVYTGNTVAATSILQFASHIHFRRYWVHGDWTTLAAGSNSMTNGFNLSGCYYCSVVGSQVSQALRPGAEGHAILGQGLVYKIDNDWLEGESSGVFSGGFASPPAMAGFVPFQDVQLGRVRSTFPYSWLGQTIPGTNPTKWAGKSLVRKNCEELKEGERILSYGVICENVDNSGGQRGVVTSLNVRNTSGGGATPQNYQSTLNDISIQNSIYRNACEGFGMDGRSASASGNGGGVSYSMNRVALSNLLQYDITQTGPGCPTTTTGMQITNGGGGQYWQGTITENSDGTATFVANCSQDAGGCIGQVASGTVTNAGTSCTAGTLTISAPPTGSQTATASYACKAGGSGLASVTITYPGAYYTTAPTVTGFSGTCNGCVVTLKLNASPVSPSTALGFQVMDISAGDPVGISNCTQVPAFNLQTKKWFNGFFWPTEVQALAVTGSAPWSGSFDPAGVTVQYNWTGVSSGSVDNAGYCTLTNGEGGPENLSINHMTFITDATQSIGNGPSASNGTMFTHNHTFVNSIMLSAGGTGKCGGPPCAGWWNDALSQGEGNATETYNYDTGSMTAAWLVWPGRLYTNYFEYSNNPSFPDPECSPITGNWVPSAGGSLPSIGGCNPPNSMYFPATPYCTGASASYSGPGTGCVGFTGAMSTSSMPLALSDYHGYQLLGSSFFHNAASDGMDMGVLLPAVDSAQTTTWYACPLGACVSSWPFPTQNPPFISFDTVTFKTSPTGLSYIVDGNLYTTQQTFSWIVGSSHSVSVSSPQPGNPGTQFAFGSWSDGGGQSHTIIAPAGSTPYTASFNMQYQLTTQASPSDDGTVLPGSGGYYAQGASIPLTATPIESFAFTIWTTSNGGTFDSNTSGTANFTMPAAPTTVTGNFSLLVPPVATITALQSSVDPSFTGDSVTFSASVTYGSNTPVGANGSITFTENGGPVAGGPAGPVALDANGQASFSTTALTESTHSITATYSGFSNLSVSYLASSRLVSQEVDNHTVVTGSQYCNQGPVNLQSAATGTPYPSKSFVTGASSSAFGITLVLNKITSDDIQALNLLLVSPNGKLFVPFANAGDASSINAVNVTLDDAAPSPLPTGTPLANGTFKPGSFIGSAFDFASPAPAGPYDYAATDGAATFASEFNNTNPNGTWELFAQTGSGGDGTIAGGWCINIPVIAPVWSVTKSHSGNFTPGQTGTWTIGVSNAAPSGTSSGAVTVADTLPTGYTVNAAAGTDWACSGIGTQAMSCTNSDAVAGGSSFSPITLTVNVPANSPASVQNTATASGGGALNSSNSNTDTVAVNQAPSITSANSTTLTVGIAGSFTVTTTGSPAPGIAESGALPSGVTFVDNHDGTGTLSGTPTANGLYSISFTASNSVGSPATQAFTVTVNQAPAITSANNTVFVLGTPGSFSVTTTGYPTPSLSETGALPSGVTFVDNRNGTGTLSGTPLTSGVFSINITASNSVGSPATQTFTLTVNQVPSITSGDSTTFLASTAGSFTVTAIGYPIPSLSETGPLPDGVTFVDSHNGTGTLSGNTPSTGVYGIGFTASNGVGSPATQTFTLTVNQSLSITSASNTAFTIGTPGSFTVTTTGFPIPTIGETGALPDGVTFADNHDGTGTLSGTPAASGVYSISFTASNGAESPATQTFTLTVNEPPAITSANNTTFVVGTPGSFTVTSTGYPTPSLGETGALPGGVSFVDNHDGTGKLSGTPTTSGVYSIGFTASNTAGSSPTQTFTLTVNQAPSITSASNTTFVMGTAGSFTVTTTAYPTPSISESGSLPSGVTFADNHDGTGTLSGNPTASGVYSINFTATNGVGSQAAQTFTLTVNQAPAITSVNNTTFTVGTAGTFTVNTTGYPTAGLTETGPLPSGVTFVDNHNGMGTLSGTPTASGVYSISFTASNGVGSPSTQTFTLTVNQPPAITSANNTTFVLGTAGSFTVNASGYPIPSLGQTGSLPTGVAFVDNHNGTGTLSGTPNTSGVYSISFTASNGVGSQATQTFTLTVNQAPAITSANNTTFIVGTAGSFTMNATGYPIPTLGQTGSLPAGVTFSDNHNGTGSLSGTPTTSGVFSVSFTASNGVGSQATQTFSLTVDQAPSITSASNTTFVMGTVGSFTVNTTGYPTSTLSETGTLPSGVTFADNRNGTGTLSGTPTTSGVFSISFTASNGVGSPATQTFTLTVNQAPAITSANNTTFTIGTAGSFVVNTTGYPAPGLSETGTLPAGVTFVDNHNGTGTLAGTPTASGVFSISFTASNGVGSPATQTFTLTVDRAPAVTSANSTTFTVGTAGSFTVNTTGYPTPSLAETGALPGGVTFVDNHNGTGTLSGTPTTSGAFSISFTASNSVGSPATQTFTLTVNQAPAITSANNTTLLVGTAGSFTVTTTGFPAPSIGETGALPGGVTFVDNHNGTGTLSGTPTTFGVFSISFTASNAVGSPATQTFTLTMNQAPAITSANSTIFLVSKAGSFTVTTAGYPIPSIIVKGTLPKGVKFVDNHDGTGTLSGTPTAEAVYSISFTASNSAGSPATQTFTVTVGQVPAIASANKTSFIKGTANSFTVSTSGYPTPSVSEAGALPSGVTFVDNHAGNGKLSGTPTATGVFTITFTAQNGVGSPATQTFTLTVGQAPAITSANNATFALNKAGSFTVTTTGYPTASITVKGTLAKGVKFVDNGNGTGTLSGTPTAKGSFSLTFTASNGVGSNATQTFTLTVN